MDRFKPYGPRGVIMLCLAVVSLGRAIAYLPSAHPTFTPALLQEWPVPIPLWGLAWGMVGALLAFQAWRRDQALALAVMASMSTLWAGIYIWAAGTRAFEQGFDASRGAWITAATYLATAVTVICVSRMINRIDREEPHA
jgi:peptidoglycan/LPS O-acetylase OafA/YrhL